MSDCIIMTDSHCSGSRDQHKIAKQLSSNLKNDKSGLMSYWPMQEKRNHNHQ